MTDTFQPIDQAERQRIASCLDETLFVEAGAGTGKTTAMVERIVSLVKKGNEISRIAAITFTEAAAAELRDRVRRELEKKGSKENNDFCLKAAADIDNASIQTLHSFAGAILREQPLQAGLPPGFEVIEEIEADIEFEEKWQSWLDEAMNSPTVSKPLVWSIRLGLNLDKLKSVAASFHENYDILPSVFPPVPEADRKFSHEFADTVKELPALLPLAYAGENDPLVKHCRRLLEIARRMEAADPESDAGLVILSRAGKLSCKSGSKKDWGTIPPDDKNACTIIKEILDDLHERVSIGLELIRRAAVMPLLESLRQFALDYAAERRKAGRAQFHDLLIWTRDLLKNDRDVRRFFQQKFSHIMIDEFQDTDPIQAEIAFLLSERADEDGKFNIDWLKAKLVPGKLFVVGDPKQSIYRFRRADIITVGEVKKLICAVKKDNEVAIVQNFRSQSSVIDWVNAIFSEHMKDDGTGMQASYIPLESRWNPPEIFPPLGVHYLGGSLDDKIDNIRRQESNDLARTICTLKSRPWQIRDENGIGLRAVKHQDICILMPARTSLPTLERALDEWNIPYRIESQSMLLDTQDVRELLSCLRAIDAPSDKIALVSALRSSAFAVTDVELLEFMENGGNLDYIDPGAGSGPVREALDVLARYHKNHIWQTPAEVIESFIRERCMEQVSFGRSRPRERLHRLQFVAEKARAFSEVKESSLRGFLDWIERLADERARMTEVPVPETDEDAVRIMTIHAAKGREFPVVILMGIGSSSQNHEASVLVDRKNNQVEVSIGTSTGPKFTTAGFENAKQKEKDAEEAERLRLMYVATTRAKDHLIISLYRKHKTTCFAATIEKTCKDNPDIWHQVEFQTTTAALETAAKEKVGSLDTEADRTRWLEARKSLIKRASRPATIPATTITRITKEAMEGDFPTRTGRGGTKLGRAVHSVLQSIDLATGAGLDRIAAAQAVNEGIPERAQEVKALVLKAINSPTVKRAVASGRPYREVFISSPLDKCAVNGFIDLLFAEEGGFVIVDYKTDNIDEVPSQSKQDQYSLQAGIYALAVNRITGRPVKEVILLFLKNPTEISFTNIDNLMAQARKAVEKVCND